MFFENINHVILLTLLLSSVISDKLHIFITFIKVIYSNYKVDI